MTPSESRADRVPSNRMASTSGNTDSLVLRWKWHRNSASIDASALTVLVVAQGKDAASLGQHQAMPPTSCDSYDFRWRPSTRVAPQMPQAARVSSGRSQAAEHEDFALVSEQKGIRAATFDSPQAAIWTRRFFSGRRDWHKFRN